MTDEININRIEEKYQNLKKDAEQGGYHLNPDISFTKALVEGLLVNESRYGYGACPCRLSLGSINEDRDIICPCDYRDADLTMSGACYCGLYLTSDVIASGIGAPVVPERRPDRSERNSRLSIGSTQKKLPYPVWRCRVCGYLAARDNPPDVCPICKAKHDRFEIFLS
ncbi:MAG TPA: ferredoxin-thioredoxin reductase catalytic domain-containing protein [Methanospirillum sp.]|nr:ferredoxin-thioredoxin reductase catalytic domain-containing protein [Methanospirillum sp.]